MIFRLIAQFVNPNWFEFPVGAVPNVDRAARIEGSLHRMEREWTHYSPSRQDRIRQNVRKARKVKAAV